MGAFFPSSECQRDLLLTTYKEANINPLDVNYFEAHGTGTKVFINNNYYLIKHLNLFDARVETIGYESWTAVDIYACHF